MVSIKIINEEALWHSNSTSGNSSSAHAPINCGIVCDRGACPRRQRCDQRPGPQNVSKPTRRPRLLSADWSVRLTGSGTEGEGCRAAARAAAVPKGGRGHRCSQSQTLGDGTAAGDGDGLRESHAGAGRGGPFLSPCFLHCPSSLR